MLRRAASLLSPSIRSFCSEAEPARKARWVQVNISSISTGKTQVRLALPVPLLTFGIGMAKRYVPELKHFDAEEVKKLFEQISVDELKAMGVEDGNLITVEEGDSRVAINIK
eukprot:CAMPEP_0113874144 /NCGR_PEP_ID=MMETSP0780_2-20120614/4170_1 /TAXON_ID=652834 /ORGANISM="Palpitomonas bilix" /LENGTH=111 /DNA_ID=CAMNT_0000859883 /DNA_START=38 /DNA_END=373 /DNA_ORIENTATION=- /assembly_acc=CAM_ASM_000599